MLAEFLKALTDTIRKGDAVSVVRLPGEERKAVLACGGQIEHVAIPPPLERIELSTVEDLCSRASTDSPTHCFVSLYGIVLLLDPADRREYAKMHVEFSRQWKNLHELDGKAYAPRDAVRLLRTKFAATAGLGLIIKALSRIDFERSSTGRSHVEHGRESLGRAVEATVQQADEVPEHFDLTVPVFAAPLESFTARLRVLIYLDLNHEQVMFTLEPDGVSRACRGALEDLVEHVRSAMPSTCTVYNGSAELLNPADPTFRY